VIETSGDAAAAGLRIIEDEVLNIFNKLTLHVYMCDSEEFIEYLIGDLEKYQTPNCVLQIIPKNFVVSMKHIKLAAYLAFKAFDKKRNISKKKHIELLLYLLGERQIGKVIEKIRRLGRAPYLIILACRDAAANAEEVVRKARLQDYCSKLECTDRMDPLEVSIDINIVKSLFGLRENGDIVKSVLCKISSLILQT